MSKSKEAKLLARLREHLYWDGHAYWLPDICVKEGLGADRYTPEPTQEEFLAVLFDWLDGQEKL